jgi:hypothetical protein
MRYVELRRHTDNDGDRLTDAGVAAAHAIGLDRLHPPYAAFVSTGAHRATQMLEILRHAAGDEDVPVVDEPALRSAVEDRWREASRAAGATGSSRWTPDGRRRARRSSVVGPVRGHPVPVGPVWGRPAPEGNRSNGAQSAPA